MRLQNHTITPAHSTGEQTATGPTPLNTTQTLGVPAWMAREGIQPGQWLSLTKPQLRAMIRPDRPLKVQVYACLLLNSAGYQGAIAYTMSNGKRRPLSPANIAGILHRAAMDYFQSAGINQPEAFKRLREDKQQIRRVLADLETDGLIERRTHLGQRFSELSADELQRLAHGSTRIHVWATPKPANARTAKALWDYLQEGEEQENEVGNQCLPVARIRLIRQLFSEGDFLPPTAAIQADSTLQELIIEALSAATETFQRVVLQRLPSPNAQCLPNVVTPGLPAVVSSCPPLESKAERNDEKGFTGPASSPEYSAIAELLQIDDDAASKLLNEARKVNASVTPRVIVHLAASKLLQIGKGVKNRAGLILSTVPKMAKGSTLRTAVESARQEIDAELHEARLWMAEKPEDYATDQLRQLFQEKTHGLADRVATLEAEKRQLTMS